jgi:RHS repeat-associated protein
MGRGVAGRRGSGMMGRMVREPDITAGQFSSPPRRALLGWGGMVVERNTFSAYGLARHHRRGDVTGDGGVDSGDTGLIDSILGATIDPNGTGGYRVEADLNRDGKISLTDRTMVGSPRAAIPAGWISDRTGADNPVGYAGYFFSHETDQYCQRFRWYDPRWGRWMQRDPAGDVDGVNGMKGADLTNRCRRLAILAGIRLLIRCGLVLKNSTYIRRELRFCLAGVVAIGLAGCRHAAIVQDSVAPANPEMDCFFRLIAANAIDADRAMWVLSINREYGGGYGWAAEVRDGFLHVVELRFSHRDCVPRDVWRSSYGGITPNREAALNRIFGGSGAVERLHAGEWWMSAGTNNYAGHGKRYFQTFVVGSESAQVSEWISGAPRASTEEQPEAPIELCLPWLISQYYRAAGEGWERF